MPTSDKSLAPPQAQTEDESHGELSFLQAGGEQEEAVSDVVEAAVSRVLEFVRDGQLDLLACDNAAALVTNDTHKIYATFDIRYDVGDLRQQKTMTAAEPTTCAQQRHEDKTCPISGVVIEDPDNLIIKSAKQVNTDLLVAGTLRPSPEPQPSTIDRWARGWVASRSTESRGTGPDDRSSDDVSDGGRSVRSMQSTRSLCTILGSASRVRALRSRKEKEEDSDDHKPFPLEREILEDQSLPPAPKRSNGNRGTPGDHGGSRGIPGGRTGRTRGSDISNGSDGDGSPCGVGVGGDGSDESIGSALKDFGGREWTVDGSGELLFLNPPSGDALPGTVVNTSYACRDLENTNDPATMDNGRGEGGRPGGGVTTAGKGRATVGGSSSRTGREASSASLRGNSRWRSSRRHTGKEINGSSSANKFFALEPTLQPSLTASLEILGPGVSVSDGGAVKEGPHWPQDPNHMSRSEYLQRQRKTDAVSSFNALGGNNDDTSTLGFSLGSIQSAPAPLGRGSRDGGRGGQKKSNPRVSTAGPNAGRKRGGSFTAFETVNPLEGGIRIEPAASPPQSQVHKARFDGGSRAGRGGERALSRLSISEAGQEEWRAAGPESNEDDEEESDPHLSLVKDPEWGNSTRGSAKIVGALPKVKHVSRERPLTHARPRTHNPRDPHKVPSRAQAHASPKIVASSHSRWQELQPAPWEGRRMTIDDVGSLGGSTSLPSLTVSLTGWGDAGTERTGGVRGAGKGLAVKDKGRQRAQGIITMTKPREVLVEGLLR